jgi:hypothetical protein
MQAKQSPQIKKNRWCIDKVFFTAYLKHPFFLEKERTDQIFIDYQDYKKRLFYGKRAYMGIYIPMIEFGEEVIQWIHIMITKENLSAQCYINLIKFYLFEHNLKEVYGYHDSNLLPLINEKGNVFDPGLEWFAEAFIEAKRSFYSFYCDFLHHILKLNDLDFEYNFEPMIKTKQVEIAFELINTDISEVQGILLDAPKVDNFARYMDQTRTIYLNKHIKRKSDQIKGYQKAAGLTRIEFTINSGCEATFDGEHKTPELCQNIIHSVESICLDMGIKLNDFFEFSKDQKEQELLCYFAAELGVNLFTLKTLLSINTWKASSQNRVLTQKLVRKGLLLKSGERGRRTLSKKVKMIRMLIYGY